MSQTMQLTVPPKSGFRVSKRAFARLCRANPDLRMGRSATRELWIMPPAGSELGSRNAGLTGQLWAWNRDRGLGVVFDSSSGFTLPNGMIHAPDAAWIRRERWEALKPARRKGFAPICPDFVAELTSPSDEPGEVRNRIEEFMTQGAHLGGLLHPKTRIVEIHRPGRPLEVLKNPATRSGEDVLPGFVLDLKGILFD